jgi:hypothetical protein
MSAARPVNFDEVRTMDKPRIVFGKQESWYREDRQLTFFADSKRDALDFAGRFGVIRETTDPYKFDLYISPAHNYDEVVNWIRQNATHSWQEG